MTQISNRLYITALEDGTTLHANLSAERALSQSWNGDNAVPNWQVPTNPLGTAPYADPVIHLTLLSGATNVGTSDITNQKWYHDNNEIFFMDSPTTLTYYTNEQGTQTATVAGYWSKADSSANTPDYKFFKHVVNVGGVSVPALRITSNFATSDNVDVDTITFKGSYVISGSSIDFSCTAQVKISAVSKTGFVGVIDFQNGISDITEKGGTVVMTGHLYDGASGQSASALHSYKWYINDVANPISTSNTCTVYENEAQATAAGHADAYVTDHATIRCEFFDEQNNRLGVAYAGIDDMQDPEFMYIQYAGNNGNSASLRSGETANFMIWVGTRENAAVLGGASTPTYGHMKIMLLNAAGEVMDDTGLATNIPDPESDGWRVLDSGIVDGKFPFTPHYDTVMAGGKNITGILMASTAAFPY